MIVPSSWQSLFSTLVLLVWWLRNICAILFFLMFEIKHLFICKRANCIIFLWSIFSFVLMHSWKNKGKKALAWKVGTHTLSWLFSELVLVLWQTIKLLWAQLLFTIQRVSEDKTNTVCEQDLGICNTQHTLPHLSNLYFTVDSVLFPLS